MNKDEFLTVDQLRQHLKVKTLECLRSGVVEIDIERYAKRAIEFAQTQQLQYVETQAAINNCFGEVASMLVAFWFLGNGLDAALQTEFDNKITLHGDGLPETILCLLHLTASSLNLSYQDARIHEVLLAKPYLNAEFKTACDSLSRLLANNLEDVLLIETAQSVSDQVKIARGFAAGATSSSLAELAPDQLAEEVAWIYVLDCPFTKGEFDLLWVAFWNGNCRLLYSPDRNDSWQKFNRSFVKTPNQRLTTELQLMSASASNSLLRFFGDNQPMTISLVTLASVNLPFHVLEDSQAECCFIRYSPSIRELQPQTLETISFWSPFAPTVSKSIQIDSKERILLVNGVEIEYPNAESVKDVPNHKNNRLLVNSEMEKWKLHDLSQTRIESVEGKEATRERFLKHRFDKFDIIHVASHAWVNHKNPMLNHIVLYDECIHFADIQALDLTKTSLVFLNCCSSDWGTNSHTNENLSLAWAFKSAGAKSVVGTRWPVDDSAAFIFMASFYQCLLSEKEPITKAFSTAKRSLSGSLNFSHPINWGAYVLLDG